MGASASRAVVAPGRLLVRGVNWLGDAVMSTPALMRLREALPEARITLLTQAKLEGLWVGQPAVDEVVTFAKGESVWRVGRRLREGRFEAALVLPNSLRSALEVWLGRIPRRIGYATHGRGMLINERVEHREGAVEMRKRGVAEVQALVAGGVGDAGDFGRRATGPTAHHVHQYLQLAAALGASREAQAPRLWVTKEEQARVRTAWLGRAEEVGGRVGWLGLNAGAEYGAAKRWPVGNFVAVARAIQERTQCSVLIFGGPADRELAAEVEAGLPGAVNVAGRTTLRELVVGLSLCRVVLTNDTGPMHAAAAVGTPVVVPFGSTSPELTGPGLPGDGRHRLLKGEAPCAPCFLRECPIDFRCMKSVTVERVVNAVRELWDERRLGGEDGATR